MTGVVNRMDEKKRIFSGMRPTGKLHYGHMAGALINWVKLQEEYNCFFGIVDWHAMMSDYADVSKVKANCREILLDWLAVGVDPNKAAMAEAAFTKHFGVAPDADLRRSTRSDEVQTNKAFWP